MLSSPFPGSVRSRFGRHAVTPLIVATLVGWFGVVAQPLAGKGRGKKVKLESKLDRELQRTVREGGSARVIVRPRHGKLAEVKERLGNKGRGAKTDLLSVGAFTAELSAGDLAALASDPDVEGVSSDAPVRSFGESLTERARPTRCSRSSAPTTCPRPATTSASRSSTPASTTTKTSSTRRTDKFWDFIQDTDDHPFDDYGHGTHVSGVVTGTGKRSPVKLRGNSKKERKLSYYRGIAPKARIYSFKVLDASGAGYTSAVIKALEFITANKDRLKIQIVNLSLGHPVLEPAETDPLVMAVEAASREGLIVVASAGNYGRNPETGVLGYAGIMSPGNAPSAITVGAYDTHNTISREDDSIPGYSSRGPTWYDGLAKPDLVAPGHAIVAPAAPESALFREYPQRRVLDKDGKPRYFRLSGTSMAAAVTSGTIALMLERQ